MSSHSCIVGVESVKMDSPRGVGMVGSLTILRTFPLSNLIGRDTGYVKRSNGRFRLALRHLVALTTDNKHCQDMSIYIFLRYLSATY